LENDAANREDEFNMLLMVFIRDLSSIWALGQMVDSQNVDGKKVDAERSTATMSMTKMSTA
jgi:hypothetical protein